MDIPSKLVYPSSPLRGRETCVNLVHLSLSPSCWYESSWTRFRKIPLPSGCTDQAATPGHTGSQNNKTYSSVEPRLRPGRDISTHRSRQFLPFQAISNIFHGLFPSRDSRLRQTKRIRRLAKGIINDKCEPGPKGKEEHQAGAGPVEIQSGESNTAVLHQEGKEQIRGSIEVDPLGP